MISTHRTTATTGRRLGALGAAALLACAGALAGAPSSAAQATGASLVALTGDGLTLERFESDDPSTVEDPVEITGLAEEEVLVGIDVRPATGALYGLSDLGQLYVVDVSTGVATASGATLDPLPSGGSSGVDFNPVPDRLRIVGDTGQNLRADVETGAVTVDQQLTFAAGDANEGTDPVVSAAGYTNSQAGATSTQLYVIDTELDVLALQDPPNDGVLNTVGELGVDVSAAIGLDIDPTSGTAFVAFSEGGLLPIEPTTSTLLTVDLTTGTATEVGVIESATAVLGLARIQAVGDDAAATTTSTSTSPTTAAPAPGQGPDGTLPVTGGPSGRTPAALVALVAGGVALVVGAAARRDRRGAAETIA